MRLITEVGQPRLDEPAQALEVHLHKKERKKEMNEADRQDSALKKQKNVKSPFAKLAVAQSKYSSGQNRAKEL